MANKNEKKVLTKKEYTKLIRSLGAVSGLDSLAKGLHLGISMGVIKTPQECEFLLIKTIESMAQDSKDLLDEYDIPIGDSFSMPELMEKIIVVEDE